MKNSISDKKVIVIGAGIAGLVAGIYAKRSGFNVILLEKHNIPGGLCTSWTRKGYTFEGGMHWLTGSNETIPLHKVWKETGALADNNPIFYKDPFYTLQNEGTTLCLYRNPNKLATHFLEHSPEDKKAIKRLRSDIKLFTPVHIPVNDIPFLKAKHRTHPSLKELLLMAPAAIRLSTLTNTSIEEYIHQFKSEDIRHLLAAVNGNRYNALSLIYTLGTFASGDCGYPEGGSLRLTKNMADYFVSIGGKIEYGKKAEKIIIEGGRVKGVFVGSERLESDSVIVTQDTCEALTSLFETPLNEKWAKRLLEKTVTEENMFIALGIKKNLSHLPRALVFPLKEPFCAGGLEFEELRVNNYAEYSGYSSEGCTSLTCLLLGSSWDYWKTAKEDGTYAEKKKDIAERFIQAVQKRIPEIEGNIEVFDVATPLTYHKFCGSWHGGWMTVMGKGDTPRYLPSKSSSVKGLYFAGQRLITPGGLPCTAVSGRKAAQYLCRDNGVTFI